MITTTIKTLSVLATLALSSQVQASLIAHYKFDEASGATSAIDSVGSNNATINGSVVSGLTGKSGNAYSFTNDLTSFVSLANPSFINSLTTSGALTMSAWVNTSATISGIDAVVSIGNSSNYNQFYDMGVQSNAVAIVNRTNDTTPYSVSGTATGLANGTWHHIVSTIEHVGGDTNLKVYMDGALKGSGTLTGIGAPSGLDYFTVGVIARQNVADPYTGLVDDVQIYDSVLSSTQISFLNSNPGMAVPEPSMALLALSSLAVFFRRKRA